MEDYVEKFIRRDHWNILYNEEYDMFIDDHDSNHGEMSHEDMVEIVNILKRKISNERRLREMWVPRFDSNIQKEEKVMAIIRVLKLLDGTEYSITISHLVDVLDSFLLQFYFEDIRIHRHSVHIPPTMINSIEIKSVSEKGEYLIDRVTDNWEHDVLSYLDNHNSYDDLTEEQQEDLDTPKREPLSNALKVKVLDRDDYKCQMCGATVEDGAKLHIDHILPVSKGGKTVESNLQVLCSDCNHGKYNKDYLKHDKRKLMELEGK